MHAYLNMTLEEARAYCATGNREYWAEARLTREVLSPEINGVSAAGFHLVTFVRATIVPKGIELKAGRGQVIIVTAPGHSRTPICYWGKPIVESTEPLVREVALARLKASIRQPKPKRQTVDSSKKPATFALDRPKRARA